MLETLVVIFGLIGLLCRGHSALALENVALRQSPISWHVQPSNGPRPRAPRGGC